MKTFLLTFSSCMNNIASCISPDVSHHPVAPVCQADTSASAPTTSTTSTAAPTTTIMTCPSGWTEFQGGCYQFFGSTTETWVVADAFCLAAGARLTSVHSEEEEDFLNGLSNGNNFWIGGYPSDNTWVWQTASHFGQGWSSSYCSSTSYEYYFICKLV